MSRPRFRIRQAVEARDWLLSEPEPGLLRISRRPQPDNYLWMVGLSGGGAFQWATGLDKHYGPRDLFHLLDDIRAWGTAPKPSPVMSQPWISIATAEAMGQARGRILARALD
jgi:hypothetical protein